MKALIVIVAVAVLIGWLTCGGTWNLVDHLLGQVAAAGGAL